MSWNESNNLSHWGETNGLGELIGRKIVRVDLTEDRLDFHDSKGVIVSFTVDGDCCSTSYFYDINGAEKLYTNGPVTEVGEVPLHPDSFETDYGETKCYGYKLVTMSQKWGEQTTVFSFRNDSNGYYGGELKFAGITEPTENAP